MANNYEINYEDERFTDVEADKKEALSEVEQTYGGMIKDSDDYYQAQIDASKEWADKQSQLQQEKTDFAIEQIEQQKEQAQKDYTKEQSGAYVDWQKQSNQYGANAEKMASSGLTETGFSESSQVSMYNTYQSRITAARESFSRAVLNYNNAIKDARLQNNSVLAEIAYQALQQQLELSLAGFQYKNQLLIEQANKKAEVEDRYYARYQDVLAQINSENSLAEQIRQFNEKMAEEKRQFDATMAARNSSSSGSSKSSGSSAKSSGSATVKKTSTGKFNAVQIDQDKSDSGATISPKNVLSLGYGPISGSTLAKLEDEGKVTATQNGNTISFKNTTPTLSTGFLSHMKNKANSKLK